MSKLYLRNRDTGPSGTYITVWTTIYIVWTAVLYLRYCDTGSSGTYISVRAAIYIVWTAVVVVNKTHAIT